MIVTEYFGDAGEYEKLSPTSSTGITRNKRLPLTGTHKGMQAKAAFMTIEDNTINFTLDDTPPTNTAGTDLGHQLVAGESLTIVGANAVKNFRCIDRVSGSAAGVKITLYF